MDELLINSSVQDPSIYKEVKLITVIREPVGTLNNILDQYNIPQAISYYKFRLNRLMRIVREHSGVLLTYSDLCNGRGSKVIQEYLQVNEPIPLLKVEPPEVVNRIPLEQLKVMSELFEKCLYQMKRSGVRTSASE